jgi:ABC-2 type transport system permease protein
MTAQPNPPPLFSQNPTVSGLGYHGAPTRPFYWSVWREVWENHSLYIAPLIVAAVVLFGSSVSSFHLPERRHAAMLLPTAARRAAIELPYDVAAMVIIMTAFVVGLFYCLDALHGERRERSILFWKSLPVSDFTTVLSKTTVPLLILPLIIFGIIVATQFVMMLISSVALAPSGLSGTTWANYNLFKQSLILVYGLIVIALWHAPIYGWALLVSGWARRAPFLWAVLPPLAIGIFEKVTFNTLHTLDLLKYRVFGPGDEAFAFRKHDTISVDSLIQLTPGRFLSSPGLWIGLLFAAGFIIAAIRLRRYRGPL